MSIQATLVSGHPGDLQMMVSLAGLLQETGRVEPDLLVMRDDTPDPCPDLPFIRVPELESDEPVPGVDLEDVAGYERYAAQYVPGPHFAGREHRAAAGYCRQLAELLPTLPSDCFVVWNGASLATRALVTMARVQRRPVVWLESGYFSRLPVPSELGDREVMAEVPLRTLIWDPVGAPAQGHSLIDEEWESYPEPAGVGDYIETLKRERSSKYGFAEEPTLKGPTPPVGARILLVAGQVIYDSSMFFCRAPVKGPMDLVQEVAFRVPQDWFVLFKPHPLGVYWQRNGQDFEAEALQRFDNIAFLPRRSALHQAIAGCDAFLAINSTALVEAAMYDRPAISLGTGFSRGRGFTHDLASLNELTGFLRRCPKGLDEGQRERLRRFVGYLAYEYVIPVGSPTRAVRRIEQAISRAKGA